MHARPCVLLKKKKTAFVPTNEGAPVRDARLHLAQARRAIGEGFGVLQLRISCDEVKVN